jgi:uncharacterized integral membrane protein (TIGR00697 family)
MNNELLFLAELFFVFGGLLLIKKLLGKKGLIAWVGIAGVLANLQVAKCINIFGLEATLGNVLFASSFLATDIISECYGKKEAKKAVATGIVFMIMWIVISQFTLWFAPSEFDIAHEPMQGLFSITLRTTAASVFMYALANIADVYLFEFLSKKTKGKHLWLRNNICTIACNCLENFGFVFLAFAGIMDVEVIMQIALTTCAIEALIAILDTPFAYAARRIKSKEVLLDE